MFLWNDKHIITINYLNVQVTVLPLLLLLTGSPGDPGTSGRKGVDGTQGRPGLPGLPGQKGEPGRVAAPGQKGVRGPAGRPGVDGNWAVSDHFQSSVEPIFSTRYDHLLPAPTSAFYSVNPVHIRLLSSCAYEVLNRPLLLCAGILLHEQGRATATGVSWSTVPVCGTVCRLRYVFPHLHLTTSNVMVIVWRLIGNIIRTVLFWQRATSSMGTVNKNSSHSPVGPWVCLLCVFGCMIYLYVHVYFVLPWSVESFPFVFWRWRNKLKWAPFEFYGSIPFRAIVNNKQCEVRGYLCRWSSITE